MKRIILILSFSLITMPLAAQHEHHERHDTASKPPKDGLTVAEENMHEMEMMSHAFSLQLPMSRNGSGTGWLPDASPMYATMFHSGKWMLMFHGNVFIRYNSQDIGNKGSRGANKVDAPDMLMLMGQRKTVAKGLFHFSIMLSTDAIIAGGSGYPLLFQTGETWEGKPLVDRQHPHDLFSELSVSYSKTLSDKMDAFIYIGYPGEPALGPVTFMHRPSGMFNPDAPISHHWADATHISFGVGTLGFRYAKFKLEVSSFTGREPDENRYDFDKPLFDSRSARLSYNPNRNWSFQVSHGYIKSPEALRSLENIYRASASASCSYPLSHNNTFDATAYWGQNKQSGKDGSNAILLEANWRLKKTILYTRYEWVQKSTEELDLNPIIYGDNNFSIHAFTIGTAYDLFNKGHITVAGGGQLSLYHADDKLDNLYGNNPLGGELYLRFCPKLM